MRHHPPNAAAQRSGPLQIMPDRILVDDQAGRRHLARQDDFGHDRTRRLTPSNASIVPPRIASFSEGVRKGQWRRT